MKYVCKRCKKSGHYIQNCPTNSDPEYDLGNRGGGGGGGIYGGGDAAAVPLNKVSRRRVNTCTQFISVLCPLIMYSICSAMYTFTGIPAILSIVCLYIILHVLHLLFLSCLHSLQVHGIASIVRVKVKDLSGIDVTGKLVL